MQNDKRLLKVPGKYRPLVKADLRGIVDLIQRRRRELSISQTRFAEEINISFKTLQAIEQGSRKPSLEVLLVMCRALKLSLVVSAESQDSNGKTKE